MPLLRAAERWRLGMNGHMCEGFEPSDLLKVSTRLTRIRWDSRLIRKFWPADILGPSDSLGMAALVINAMCDLRFHGDSGFSRALFSLLCGTNFHADDLMHGLQQSELPLGQLNLPLRPQLSGCLSST